jgi:hypothetical protein
MKQITPEIFEAQFLSEILGGGTTRIRTFDPEGTLGTIITASTLRTETIVIHGYASDEDLEIGDDAQVVIFNVLEDCEATDKVKTILTNISPITEIPEDAAVIIVENLNSETFSEYGDREIIIEPAPQVDEADEAPAAPYAPVAAAAPVTAPVTAVPAVAGSNEEQLKNHLMSALCLVHMGVSVPVGAAAPAAPAAPSDLPLRNLINGINAALMLHEGEIPDALADKLQALVATAEGTL